MNSAKEFFENTTFHGLADIQATKSKPLKIFWVTFVVLVFVFCGYQVASAVYEHSKKEIVAEVEHFVTKVRPNLTICAPNNWSRNDSLNDRAVEPILPACDKWDEADFFFNIVRAKEELSSLKPDEDNCTKKTDMIPWDPNCAIALQQNGSSLAVNYVENEIKRYPPYIAEITKLEWVSHENLMNRPIRGKDIRKHLTWDFRDLPDVKCISIGEGQPTNDSGIIKYYKVVVKTHTKYVFYVNGIQAYETSDGCSQGYTYKTFVTISKRYNLRNCDRKYTLQEQEINQRQCMSNILAEASGCCYCGWGLSCPSEKLPCCTRETACKAKLDPKTLERLIACRKTPENPCEMTSYSAITAAEYLEKMKDRDPRVEIRFQNLFEVVAFRQRYRYDSSWLLSTIGGFLGLLIGGSVLSFLQAFLFCVRLCARDFETRRRSRTTMSIAPKKY